MCFYSQETSPELSVVAPSSPSAAAAAGAASGEALAERKPEKSTDHIAESSNGAAKAEEAATEPQTDALPLQTTANDGLALVFSMSPLPPSTAGSSFPAKTTATRAEGSGYTYVSRLDFSGTEGVLHFGVGRAMVCVPYGHRDEQEGRVGAIAVKVKGPLKPTHKAKLDIEIILCFKGKGHCIKPSLFLPESKQPEAKPYYTEQQDRELLSEARAWVFATHVKAAAARLSKKQQAAANRGGGSRPTRATDNTPQPPTAEPEQTPSLHFFESALSKAVMPLAQSIAALSQSQQQHQTEHTSSAAHSDAHAAALGVGQSFAASQMTGPASPQAWPSPFSAAFPSLSLPSLPSVFSAQAASPLLAAALAHSQMGALHLAEEARLLTAALAPQPSPAHSVSASGPFASMAIHSVEQPAAAAPASPSGQKRRRKR